MYLPVCLFANELTVDAFFQSHMVLQQNRPIVVWGKANQGIMIHASFDGEYIESSANEKGEWEITFRPRKASFVPKQLRINNILLEDILVGEVWICAGQSNMAFPLSKCDEKNKNIDAGDNDYKGFRILNYSSVRIVAERGYTQDELKRCNTESFFHYQWDCVTKKRLQSFSAVAAYFGLNIFKEIKVPLGIICCAVGGSAINNWIPENILKKSTLTAHWYTSDWLKNSEIFINHRKRCKDAFQHILPQNGEMRLGTLPYRFVCEPSFIFESSFAKIGKIKIKGIIWYQGESDAYDVNSVKRYETFFRLMVKSWRNNFNNSLLPFFIIQLPSYNSRYWVEMREIQNKLVRKIPYTYLIPTIDLGDKDNIHYIRKKEVGVRTANAVLDKVYGKHHAYFPKLRFYRMNNDILEISFTEVGNGLNFSKQEPAKVELIDKQGNVVFANINILNPNKIRIRVPKSTLKIHYAWEPCLLTTSLLINSFGIPVAPFEIILPQYPVFSKSEDYEYGKIISTLIDRSFDSWEFTIPKFMDRNRIQAHTRANLKFKEEYEEKFYSLSRDLKNMGINVLTRHIKSADEGAWWPSSLDIAIKGISDKNNIAKKIIDSAHINNQKIIAYHRHMEDAYWAKIHPDWICKNFDGSDIILRENNPRKKLCFNSPYADAFLHRAKELVDLGVDGFYFDEIHQAKTGCWCKYCKERFEHETGLKMPQNDSCKNYLALLEYKNVIIERLFRLYTSELKLLNPELAIIVGSNSWPAMVEDHTTENLYRIVDFQKTEYSLASRLIRNRTRKFACPNIYQPTSPTLTMFHSWVMARDAADGRPAHIWINNLKNNTDALYSILAVIAYGCIADVDQKEVDIPNKNFQKSFYEGNKFSKIMENTFPMKYVALHYPESSRFLFKTKEELWKILLDPHLKSYTLLNELHVPNSIITDSQLEDGLTDGYKVLIVPNRIYLNEKMIRSLEEFKLLGGIVIETSDYNNSKKESKHLKIDVCRALEQTPLLFRFRELERDIQVNYFQKQESNSYVINFVRNKDIQNVSNNKGKRCTLLIDATHCAFKPLVINALNGKILMVNRKDKYWIVQLPLKKDVSSIIISMD